MFVQLYLRLKQFYQKYFSVTQQKPVTPSSESSEPCYAYAYDVYYH